jgi:hypothetical protein
LVGESAGDPLLAEGVSYVTEHQIAFIGLPETGKTTFLAAFWATVRETPPLSHFTLREWPSSATYLQARADEWFQAKPVDRTSGDTINEVHLSLSSIAGDVDVRIPDLSGEAFQTAVVRRRVLKPVDEILVGASGLLLFINGAQATHRLSLTNARAVLQAAGVPNADNSGARGSTDGSSDVVPFSPGLLESEVLSTELLQIVMQRRIEADCNAHATRIGLVISAWDVLACAGATDPTDWLLTNQPMLAGVLAAIADSMPVCIFGVSAQGDDYGPESKAATRRPSQRPIVVEKGSSGSDITRPVAWVASHAE